MKNILEELYFGNINPNAKQFARGSDLDRAMKNLVDRENKLTEQLSEEKLALLFEFTNALSEVNCITSKECFINGFRLGAKIILVILGDETGCLRDII